MADAPPDPPPAETDDLLLLRSYLATRDIRCPCCHYNLRGCTQPICPECGDEVSLTIISSSNRARGYLTGLFGLALSALSALLFAGQVLRTTPFVSILSFLAVGYFVHRFVQWQRYRADYAALPRHKQQERVFLCWLGFLIFLVLASAQAQQAHVSP